MGETVTWSGRYLRLTFNHTSLVDAWRPFSFFREVEIQGRFTQFEHEHHFAPMDDGTRMRDELRFAAPFPLFRGPLEKMLRNHLRNFLAERNALVKQVAESDEWHRYLDGQSP